MSMVILTGCRGPSYAVGEWLEDACLQMGYADQSVITHWQTLLLSADLSEQLTSRHAAVILYDILDEQGNDPYTVMVNLGYFNQQAMDDNVPVYFEEAQSLLEKAKSDLATRTVWQPKTEIVFKEALTGQAADFHELTDADPGIYDVDGLYYRVSEDGDVKEISLDEVLSSLEIEATFQPDLEESIIFPDDVNFTSAPVEGETSDGHFDIASLKSQYFRFNIGDYRISGRVYSSGLDISCKRYDFYDMTLENQLEISQLKITSDISINPFDDPHILFRADYRVRDTLSLSKNERMNLVKKDLTPEILSSLQTRLASVLSKNPSVQEAIDLLRFSFPVPGTLKSLHADMVLRLCFSLNGEASLIFDADQHYGIQTAHGDTKPIQKNSWSVEPYLDGSAEFACNLGIDLMFGKYLIADLSAESGVGAEGKASVYFVNKKEKQVTMQESASSLSDLEKEIETFQPSREASVDLCADVNVYWFIRLNIGSNRKSLLAKFGVNQSFTPVRENVSLLHIEDHHVVASCTRSYVFSDEKNIENQFQLSKYQVILRPGETEQLTIEATTEDTYTWQSSKPECVLVQEGKVEALAPGVSLITVKNAKGQENACVVIVLKEDTVTFEPLSSFF